MTINEFKQQYTSLAVDIPLCDITLTEPKHQHGVYKSSNKKPDDTIIIVRPYNNGYSLVLGWKGYMQALCEGRTVISCIVTDMDRKGLLLTCSEERKLNTIKIPTCFKRTKPSAEKLNRVRQYVALHNQLDEPITVDKTGQLKDGYLRYLIARELGWKKIRTNTVFS